MRGGAEKIDLPKDIQWPNSPWLAKRTGYKSVVGCRTGIGALRPQVLCSEAKWLMPGGTWQNS